MSYYVTITRRPSPLWENGDSIPEEEWQAAALTENLRPAAVEEIANVAPYGRASDFVWHEHPEHPEVWFSWFDGQIDVKNPDTIILAKMAKLAAVLNASLISETGERFDANGQSLGVKELPDDPTLPKPSWIKRFFGIGSPQRWKPKSR